MKRHLLNTLPRHAGRPEGYGSAMTSALACTARLVSAYVVNNHVRPDDLPALIESVHSCVSGFASPSAEGAVGAFVGRMDVQDSIGQDYIVSFLNGKSYRTLKRHLSANGLSPDRYRARFDLPEDYPMVAPSYSAQRAQIAREIGLGSRAA